MRLSNLISKTTFLLALVGTCIAKLQLQPKHIAIGMGFGGRSHVKYLFEISRLLKERGHTVSYVTTEDYLHFANGYNLSTYKLGPRVPNLVFSTSIFEKILDSPKDLQEYLLVDGMLQNLIDTYEPTFVGIRQFLKEHRPDVMICDFCSPGCTDAAYAEHIPTIVGFQNIDITDVAKTPYITAGHGLRKSTTLEIPFLERLQYGIFEPITMGYKYAHKMSDLNKIREKLGLVTSTRFFANWDGALLLANTFFGFEQARPLPPNLKLIGPVISASHSSLSTDLSSFLEAHTNILFIAFGSLVRLHQSEIEMIMNAALANLKTGKLDGLIWGLGNTSPKSFPSSFDFGDQKVDSSLLVNNEHPDIRILSWAPQQAVLSHQNVRLFLSHGGLESTSEAMYTGTPILTYPFLGDQPRNGRRVHEMGIGEFVDRFATNQKEIHDKILRILTDENGSISKNIKKMQLMSHFGSRRINDAANMIEEFVYVAEICRTLPTPNDKLTTIPCEMHHLTPASKHMNFMKATNWDIYGFVLILLFFVAFFISRAIYFSTRKISTYYFERKAKRAHSPISVEKKAL